MTRHTTILVVGGTGLLGAPVARRLHADGYRVRIFTHSPEKAGAMFPDGYEIAVGDVDDKASLHQALRGCHGVHVNLFGGSDPDLEDRGTSNVAAAAAVTGAERLTYLSGATVREDRAWFPSTRAKLAAEAAIRRSGVPYTIFRAASFMEGLPAFVRGKTANVIGRQPHPWHWVAAADYARMVSAAYGNPLAAGKTLYVLGPEAMTTRDALQVYTAVAHPGTEVKTMPLWLAHIVASVLRVRPLREALPYLRYFERASELGDPREANALLGDPTTTLAQWSQQQAARTS